MALSFSTTKDDNTISSTHDQVLGSIDKVNEIVPSDHERVEVANASLTAGICGKPTGYIETPCEEQTFKKYTAEQAQAYTQGRALNYPKLYDLIVHHHASTGGKFGVIFDVGCGPGNSTMPLAKHFDKAYGTDTSEEMIRTAKELNTEARNNKPHPSNNIEFLVGRAEDMVLLAGGVENKVDLLTAGAAAHWFDMTAFWISAAKLVKPGGTVALWPGPGALFCHPSTPNAGLVQKILSRLEHEWLGPYEMPGNRISRGYYADLLLPWNTSPPVDSFPEDDFIRLEWDHDGRISSGNEFFLGNQCLTLDRLVKSYETISLMARWKLANPELVGTEDDVLVKTAKELRQVIGQDELVVGVGCALLLFKRR